MMICISTGTASELNKFLLLMQTIGLPPTPEKFEIFKNRGDNNGQRR